MARARGTISERVIQSVADATDRDPLELPPLCEATDPDALETFTQETNIGEVSFVYAGYEVTVESDGAISLDELLTRGSMAEIPAIDG